MTKEIKASGLILRLYDSEDTLDSKTGMIIPDPSIHSNINPNAYSAKTAFSFGEKFDEERRKYIEAHKESAKPITYE